MPGPEFQNKDVAAVFAAYPTGLKHRLLELRALIYEVAENVPGIGRLEETLKWGQPAYLTAASKSGTTVRIDADSGSDTQYALYVNCQTNLVRAIPKCDFCLKPIGYHTGGFCHGKKIQPPQPRRTAQN